MDVDLLALLPILLSMILVPALMKVWMALPESTVEEIRTLPSPRRAAYVLIARQIRAFLALGLILVLLTCLVAVILMERRDPGSLLMLVLHAGSLLLMWHSCTADFGTLLIVRLKLNKAWGRISSELLVGFLSAFALLWLFHLLWMNFRAGTNASCMLVIGVIPAVAYVVSMHRHQPEMRLMMKAVLNRLAPSP